MSQIVVIAIGQAGINISSAIWKLFLQQHGIALDGTTKQPINQNNRVDPFFQQSIKGRFSPRSIYVDTDPDPIDWTKRGELKDVLNKNYMHSLKEDSSNNYIRGHYTIGKQLINNVQESIRKRLQQCQSVQGIIYTHAIGGGTGSGVAALLGQRLQVSNPKVIKAGLTVYPQKSTLNSIVQPYNAVLSTSFLVNHCHMNVYFQNSRVANILDREFQIEKPGLSEVNRYIAHSFSSITSGIRFEGILNCNLRQLVTNMVPYPRAHFLMNSYACYDHDGLGELSVGKLNKMAFSSAYTPYYREGTYISASLIYRGITDQKSVIQHAREIKTSSAARFVDWAPAGIKVGICPRQAQSFDSHGIINSGRSVCFLNSCSAIMDMYADLSLRFDKLYAKRGFVHWFVGQGLSQGFFQEERQNQAALEKDYENIDPVEFNYDFQDQNSVQ